MKSMKNYLMYNGYRQFKTSDINTNLYIKEEDNYYCCVVYINNYLDQYAGLKNIYDIERQLKYRTNIPSDKPYKYLYFVAVDTLKCRKNMLKKSKNVILYDSFKHRYVFEDYDDCFKPVINLINKAQKYERTLSIEFINPDNTPVMTFFIICILGIVGLLSYNNPQHYALSASLFINGKQYWRLGSYMFVHSGILHLISNLISLWIIGKQYEGNNGCKRFCTVFLIGGIYAGLASVILRTGSSSANTLVVGASGCIYALFTANIIYYLCRSHVTKRLILEAGKSLAILIVYGVLNSNIDHYAHLGGFVAGIILQALFILYDKCKESKREYEQYCMRRTRWKIQ